MRAFIMLTLLSLSACVGSDDNPTTVKDLRVLGMRFEPPEVMLEGCNVELLLKLTAGLDGGLDGIDAGIVGLPPSILASLGRTLDFSALIADPAGSGRPLDYRLLGCTMRGDRDCNDEGAFVELKRGSTTAGELSLRLEFKGDERPLGLQSIGADGGTLLLEVIQQDTFKGLGGVRVPVILEVSAKDTGEKIYAQKLMVYTCPFFPTMKPNITPILPGLQWNGEPWAENEIREVSGTESVLFEPDDFSALEESYVVPTLQFKPLTLIESWKITWLTSSGAMGQYNTGGTNIDGKTERHHSTWNPDPAEAEPRDVDFFFVVRDGRGGSSWTKRTAHWSP